MHAQAQPSEKPPQPSTIDPADVERFSRIAAEWWDPTGKFKPLHAIGPARIGFIRDAIAEHFNHPKSSQHNHLEPPQSRHPELVSGSKKMLNQVQHDEISPPSRDRGDTQCGVVNVGEANREGGTTSRSTPPVREAHHAKLTLLDIGTGGGLIAEPMARLGATVTGIDASEKNIAVATLHAQQSGLAITYLATTAEALAATEQTFDVVLALEIVEHVADIDLFLRSCATLVKPGGLLIMSTLNRTAKSYLMAIIGAEYILRWLPRGTHSWKQFVRPSELTRALTKCGLNVSEIRGLTLNPLTRQWAIHPTDLDVNYLLTATKPL